MRPAWNPREPKSPRSRITEIAVATLLPITRSSIVGVLSEISGRGCMSVEAELTLALPAR